MQADKVEQVATVDQARHLEMFEQLRLMQAQQRHKLIRDQEEQYSRLHAEQRAMEARLVAQRHNQWGLKSGINIYNKI